MRSWTIRDLVFLRDAGVKIDTDIFADAFEYENRNYRSIALPCECGAQPLESHKLECKHATVLVLPDWYEIVSARG
jgi:hypothetical protein